MARCGSKPTRFKQPRLASLILEPAISGNYYESCFSWEGIMPVYSRANSGALEPLAILVSFEFLF
jgi:hypothetical protein